MGPQRFNVVGNDDPFNNYYWVKLMPLPVADGGADICSGDSGYSPDYPLLMYNQTVHNITIFYNCTYSSKYPDNHSLGCAGDDVVYYNGAEKEMLESHQDLKNCHHRIQVAAEAVALNGEGGYDASAMHFGEGVLVKYTFSQDCMSCLNSGGTCGSNNTDQFTCYCPDGSNALQCHDDPPAVPPPGPPPDNRSQEKKFQACEPKTCGGSTDHQNISFPFYIVSKQNSYCGLPNFGLTCSHDGFPILNTSETLYTVQNIFYHNQSLRVSIPALSGPRTTECIAPVRNISSRSTRFSVASKQKQVFLFYGCENMQEHSIGCSAENRTRSVVALYGDDVENLTLASKNCREKTSVTTVEDEKGGVEEALRRGFLMNWTAKNCSECSNSGGRCGFDEEHFTFRCYCPDRIDSESCYSQPGNGWPLHKKLIIGATAAAAITGLLSICYFTYKLPRWREKYCFPTKNNQDIETFLKNYGVLTIKRYKFSDVKKMTNSFKVKLGQGGFGAVYKGKLSSGFDVAVKMLDPSKGNGREFINEVASISRTSHVNVVTLLGFCFEGHKKVLIYEFISNGSLDKFIYRKEGVETTTFLSWDRFYQIAKGIARGLEYLHRGCSTRIFHFDIKPHNILLDENFCPKISDFGLAKLCPGKESLISMSDARGTIGYIAPEVWNRYFGKASHKSDVYSYGMMLLDIVGGKKNINIEGSQTSEIYFPDWIYKRLEQGTQLGPEDGDVTIEENELVKKMTIVGLWCIQTIPDDRPTMSKVLEMLEGSTDSIEVPPRPALSSPVRSIAESSTLLN